MTESRQSSTAEAATEHDEDRYGCVQLPDDEVVVYDQEAHTRWVQSDSAVPISECR